MNAALQKAANSGEDIQVPFNHGMQPWRPVFVSIEPRTGKGNAMRKVILATAAAATLAVTAVAAPAPAEARGGRIAAGVIGGLAGAAILGGLAANSYGYGYGPGYGYYGAPAYYGGGGYGGCYLQRERFWDGYGWRVRRVQVCD